MKGINQKPVLSVGVFMIILGVIGAVTFFSSRELFVSWALPDLETTLFVPVESPLPPTLRSPTPFPQLDLNQPLQPITGPQPQAWDGNRRVTILLMGLDARAGDPTSVPPRSDTLILFSFDPKTNTVGLLSIPRDLWVAIPGFGSGKVNTAYPLGEAYRADGGGAGLAMRTLETLLGIPIDYYALADFQLFARFIDEIGGVKLNVPEAVEISRVNEDGTKWILPGVQTLPGAEALAYVRARNTPGGDFDRVQRQQLMLLGIRDRVLNFNLIPTLIAKAPLLYGEFSDRIRTNLTANDLFKLALALQGVPSENIFLSAITLDDVTFYQSPEGLDVLLPLPERIRQARDEVFVLDDPLSPVQLGKPLDILIEEEAAKIAVFNGTTIPGRAALATEFLKAEAFNITLTDIADEIYPKTTLIDYTGNPNTVNFLVSFLNIDPQHILHAYNLESDLDIKIILGEDWRPNGE
ncbi:MAG: LCP family protein [Anaerolineales bacterium]|nr:LCP family protein [Anaerolineales bacterium]